tara:strand:- start:158 stop:799 length:642 start_codon:yes stop_codon:yes gene_type:complete
MATFQVQVQDLVGTAMTDTTAISTFMSDGLAQVYSLLPSNKLMECVTHTALSNSPSTLDLDTATIGPIMSVTRKTSQGINQICRQIPPAMVSRVTDANDLMHVTETDPVYFIKNAVLNVYPDPTASQTAEVVYLPLTAVAHGDSSIDNLSNDLTYIVVLYAAIRAATHLMSEEEDIELYAPIIQSLKNDYNAALSTIGVKGPQTQSQGAPRES